MSLRRRIAAGPPNTERQPNCSTVNSTEHNSAPTDNNNEDIKSFEDESWDGIYDLCTSPNLESKGVADVNEIEPEILSITSNAMTENQGDKYSSLCLKPDIWTQTLSRSASFSTRRGTFTESLRHGIASHACHVTFPRRC